MDTIRAINNMARAEAEGLDGARTPGGMALRRQADGMNEAANLSVVLLNANSMNPDDDKATQLRLAAAVDRQITARTSENQPTSAVAKTIMNDFYMQEAAARRLVHFHDRDPLAHIANENSARNNDTAVEILGRNGINPGKLLKTASKEDLAAIAAGRYDEIKSEHTRFGVSAVLRLSDDQMRTPTARVPVSSVAEQPRRPLAAANLPGRPSISAAAFGRKVSAER